MADRLTTVHLDDIHDSPDNLRRTIGDVSDLAASIEFIGLIEPLRVQRNGEGYKVIAGHRRLAALRELHGRGAIDPEIKVVIGDKLDDKGRTAAMLIENMQRVDLAPNEEAEGVRRLIQEHGFTQAQVAKSLGMSTQWVKDRVALLDVPDYLFTTPKHEHTDKTLPVSHLAMLGRLPADVRERLTKDGKVPTKYDIEDRTSKVKSKAQADKEMAALLKRGVMAVTEKDLKRILKTELAELDGTDQLVKLKLGDVTKIAEYMYHTPAESTVVLKQTFPTKPEEFTTSDVYVLKMAGFAKWYRAEVMGAPVKGKDPEEIELDEYEQQCAEIDERNRLKLDAWREENYQRRRSYITDTKPAQLSADLFAYLFGEALTGFRANERVAQAADLLSIELVELVPQQQGEDNDAFYERRRDIWHEQNEQLRTYAMKNSASLIRTLAALKAAQLVEDLPEPELEAYPEDEEYEDDDVAYEGYDDGHNDPV